MGAAAGWGLWAAVAGSLPELDPAAWATRGAAVPVADAALAGPLPPSPSAVDLWEYRAFAPRLPAFATGRVSITARVPPRGQLRVWLGATLANAGPMPPVQPGDVPDTPPPMRHGPPPPGADTAKVDDQPSILVDRARGRLGGIGLDCAPAPAPKERFTLQLQLGERVVDVWVDGVKATRCVGPVRAGELVVASGVERVLVERTWVQTPGGELDGDFAGGVHSAALGAGLAGLGLLAGAALPLDLALGLAPLLLLPLLGRLDLRGALDTLRLLEVPTPLGPALFAGVPAALGGVAALARRLPLWPALGVAALPALVAAAFSTGLAAWAGLLVPWAALAWVNTHPVRARVPLSWALCLVLLAGGELAARHSALDRSWVVTAGWKRGADEFRELLELKRWRSYPESGFPVQPPAPDPSRHRIVALGGSSTGGAWQMDDLGLFWPAKLEERLRDRGWEVVNQGVGGWNTLHVRLYAESQIERLQPDVLALYVGHNDVRIPSPVRWSELYRAWREPERKVGAAAAWLGQWRLYNGLKFAVLGLRPGGEGVAVPVPDARENLAAIIAAAQARGAHVLLMTEALNPDPLPMEPYAEMQAALAAETGERYLDAATALWRSGRSDLFLDDCHLSREGHVLLAAEVEGALVEAGWVAPGSAAAGSGVPGAAPSGTTDPPVPPVPGAPPAGYPAAP